MDWASILFFILAGLAILQSLLLVLQTWEHRRYARSCMNRKRQGYPKGRAAVFVPCKGLDVHLTENLRALMVQDYNDYEVNFIVERSDDPACEAIQRVMADHPLVPSRMLIAGRAIDCGQKVHNLRVATAHLASDVKYLVFVDSDAGPRSSWLRTLVLRLWGRNGGAVTGYRWFIPTRPTVANLLLYSLNSVIMSLFGRRSHHLVWGGSWGIRRELFDRLKLRDAWAGTLSDDLVATQVLRKAKVTVAFEPGCVVASPCDYSLGDLFDFIRRQYLVTRFYTPWWWAFGIAVLSASNLLFLANVGLLGVGLRSGAAWSWASLAICVMLYGLMAARGMLRQSLVKTYFPEHYQSLRAARWFDIVANPLGSWTHWLGVGGSLFGQHITWRSICYRVSRGGQVQIVRRDEHFDPEATQVIAVDETVLCLPQSKGVSLKKAG